jgi:radical SAM superfamily enzyme
LVEAGKLTEAAAKAFNWMFDLYANKDGFITTSGCIHFIRGCTGDIVQSDEARVKTIMGNSGDKDKLSRENFVAFFTRASSGAKTTAVL